MRLIRKQDRRLIEDPYCQASFFAKQAYQHFEENQELVLSLCRGAEHYPSLILQKMICSVRHESAYVGVLSSRTHRPEQGLNCRPSITYSARR